MRDGTVHLPVMVGEVVEFLECAPGEVYVDATVGCGGHAAAMLRASSPDGSLIGIDRDREALREAEAAGARSSDGVRDAKANLARAFND